MILDDLANTAHSLVDLESKVAKRKSISEEKKIELVPKKILTRFCVLDITHWNRSNVNQPTCKQVHIDRLYIPLTSSVNAIGLLLSTRCFSSLSDSCYCCVQLGWQFSFCAFISKAAVEVDQGVQKFTARERQPRRENLMKKNITNCCFCKCHSHCILHQVILLWMWIARVLLILQDSHDQPRCQIVVGWLCPSYHVLQSCTSSPSGQYLVEIESGTQNAALRINRKCFFNDNPRKAFAIVLQKLTKLM